MGVRLKRSRDPNQEMSRLDNNVAFRQLVGVAIKAPSLSMNRTK